MNNGKKKYKFTRTTPIIEIAEVAPQVAQFLQDEYGFHCIGCPLSYEETIEEGAYVHGFDEEEIDELINKINAMVD